MTIVGAAGVVVGLAMSLATLECSSRHGFVAPSVDCSTDDGFVMAGLVTAGASAVTTIIGAIWLAMVDRTRRDLDRALRPEDLAVDVDITAHGGSLILRGVY